MFSLIALFVSFRRQQAEALRAVAPAPVRAVANDRVAVRSFARAA